MKKSMLFLLFICFLSRSFGQTEQQHAFVAKFLSAVQRHDQKSTLKCMDKEYLTAQLDILEGNKTQFLDELVSGESTLTGEYIPIEFANILRIEVAEVVELEDGNFDYIFRVRTHDADVMFNLQLVRSKKYGFVGPRG